MNEIYTRQQIIDMTPEQVTEAIKNELHVYPENPQWAYSLDVMHEVEGLFSHHGWNRYASFLGWISFIVHEKDKKFTLGMLGEMERILLHATACEKAKAWLMLLVEQRLGSIATR